jgi:hypothetical protein
MGWDERAWEVGRKTLPRCHVLPTYPAMVEAVRTGGHSANSGHADCSGALHSRTACLPFLAARPTCLGACSGKRWHHEAREP